MNFSFKNLPVRRHWFIFLIMAIISLIMHFRIFKLDLIGFHTWRQAQTQTVINNFARDDFNIFYSKINDKADGDRILRMEFPLMQWIIASLCKAFGHNTMVSRIFTFIIGLFSVFGIFYLIKNVFHHTGLALIGAWAFNFSPVFYYYTLNPLPDNLALCFAIWGMAFFFYWTSCETDRYLYLSAILLSASALVKLPFIVYFTPIAIFYLIRFKNIFNNILNIKQIIIILICLVPVFTWYSWVIPTWNGNGIVKGIAGGENIDAMKLLDILWFHFSSSLPELLINYGSLLFFISGFYFIFKKKIYKKRNFLLFFSWGIIVIIYFLFEMNAIGRTHDYYLLPFLPPIFILVAFGASELIKLNKRYLNVIAFFSLFTLPVFAYARIDRRWNEYQPGFNKDFYVYKEELRKLTPPNSLCVIGNDESHFILLYYIDRKGWTLENDDISSNQLKWMINKGAKYFFTDSHHDEKPEVKFLLRDMIFNKGSIRVYTLKSDD